MAAPEEEPSRIEDQVQLAHLPFIVGTDAPLPFEIISGHRLVRAGTKYTSVLRTLIPRQLGFGGARAPIAPYEYLPIPSGPNQNRMEPLPQESWRYFGIEHKPLESQIHRLESAGDLLGYDYFRVGVSLSVRDDGVSYGAGWTGHHPSGSHLPHINGSQVTMEQLRALRATYDKVCAHDNKVFDLSTSLGELRELREMDPMSKLRFLGYCAVLESAITHDPKPSDPYDTLTRQITSKMALIANRTGFISEYPSFFGNATHEPIWKALYDYRSKLAHGSPYDFKSGKGQVLRDPWNAMTFLIKATLNVLRFGLEDPALLRDLKAC